MLESGLESGLEFVLESARYVYVLLGCVLLHRFILLFGTTSLWSAFRVFRVRVRVREVVVANTITKEV